MSRRLFNVVWLALALGGCGSDVLGRNEEAMTQPPLPLPRDVRVVLDIYSGRPNPAWNLTSSERSRLSVLLEELETLPPRGPAEGRLGYRGFLVAPVDGADGPRLEVHDEVVRHQAGQTIHYRKDTGRRLERWLLETGRPHIGDATYDSVRAELP